MRKISLFTLIFYFLIFNWSCNFTKNKISIASTNFGEEVDRLQNLIFKFNNQVLDNLDRINVWDTTHFVNFEPAIPGKFKWISQDELLFSPSQQLGICKNYSAKLNKDILKHNKSKKGVDLNKEIKFHTPYLKLVSTQAYWSKNEKTQQPEIKLNTEFNYDINPVDLVNKMSISANNKEVGFEVIETESNHSFNIDIKDVKAKNEASELEINIKDGLSPQGSNYKTDKTLNQAIILSSPFELTITEVKSSFVDGVGVVEVTTSQQIEKSSLENAYSFQPNIKTTFEITKTGFKIKGEFVQQIAYNLTINKELKGVLGGQLKSDYVHTLFFGEMPPSISFTNKKAQYISNKGNQNIGLNIVNVPKVQLQVNKIYENNILQYFNNMSGYNYDYYEDDYGDGYSESETYFYEDYNESYSSKIINKTIVTKDLPQSKGISLLNVNLNDNKKFKGIYHIKVSGIGDDYVNASKLISISDLGILAKQSKNDMMVLINSLVTSEPMNDVTVNLISTNNQNVYSLKTDKKGVAHFKDLEQKISGFKIAMITASKDEDFNYLLFKDNRVEISRFETDGLQDNRAGWWAYTYGDRNIYRPGETINSNTIVRNENMEIVSGVPVIVKLIMPNGRTLTEKRITTSAEGSASTEFSTPVSTLTGNYYIEVYNPNDVLLASRKLSVEEFMPDKIKVNQTLAKNIYNIGETVTYEGEALTFFGPPSRNRDYETEFVISSKRFYSEKHSNYEFNIKNQLRFEPDVREGNTDDNGKFKQSLPLIQDWANSGLLEGKVFTTVFDENGRPVNRLKTFEISTQLAYFGIQNHDDWVGTNQALNLQLISLDANKNTLNTKGAVVEVIKYEWQNMLENYYGSYRYNSKPIEKVVSSKVISFEDGKANYAYTPTTSGEYEIRVKLPNYSQGYSYSKFYAYSYGTTSNSSFQVNQDGEVIIETDKTDYQEKDEVKILCKTPFNGRLLLTIERNQVFEYHQLEVENKTASLTVKLKDIHVPNIYVTATLIKKANLTDIPLTVAHGLKNISVLKTNSKIPVEINCTAQSRSNTKQNIQIKTAPNAEVTVAVVDEGILSIKNFETPNPHEYFYQKRALQVSSYDLYARLFPELVAGATGGDGYGLEKRVNPLSATRFKPVSLWSGVLKSDKNGVVNFSADIGKFYGAVRVMAVAYKNQSFGNAEKEIKIFDPIVMSTSLPRFLSPGDEITMGVNLMNTTNNSTSTTPSIQLEGPLELISSDKPSANIEGNKEANLFYTIKVKNEIGIAKVKVKTSAFGESFIDETELSVRPAAGLQIKSSEGLLQAGQTENILYAADFMGKPNINITIDNSPLGQISGKFMNLIRYPHGCAEQTISTAFPQLYLSEYMKSIAPMMKLNENELNPNYNVNEAIRKITSLVDNSGHVSYWPGYSTYSLWLNAYALHFLSEAEKKGFAVNGSVKERLIEICNSESSENKVEKFYIKSESGKLITKEYIHRDKVYALYVLASAGSANKSGMNYTKYMPSKLMNSSKYLLACSYALAGDLNTYRTIMPSSFIYENNNGNYEYGYYSAIRDKALVLNALVESDINNAQVLSLVKSLSNDLKANYYLNTNELAFSLMALGKYSQAMIKPGGKASIIADGKVVGTYNGKLLHLNLKQNFNTLSIKSEGEGTVYFNCTYEGTSKTGTITTEDKTIKVRREFLNRFGGPIVSNTVNQNDLVVVKLTLSSEFNGEIKNIALTDILPAGLEIENPRITATKSLSWLQQQSYAQYMDVRDDRISYFTSLYNRTPVTFYYMTRAVSKGNFTLGPVQADAMYDGTIRSVFGPGRFIVK